MTRKYVNWVALACVVAWSTPAAAQTAPSLGAAEPFAVLGGSTVTNTGPSVITGNLGVSPGSSITGFPPGIVAGSMHAGDATALLAQNSLVTAYNALGTEPCTSNRTGQDLGGLILTPGIYCFDTSAGLTGTLTLDAQGNPNAVFIIRTGSTLTTASGSRVLLINGGQPCDVFWQVGSSATLGTSSSMIGNIIALTSITATTQATVLGRLLARNGATTLDSNTVDLTSCLAPVPTLGEWAMIGLMALLSFAGFIALRRRQAVQG